uniref:XACb0070 ribbon-helix-helix domain-containing protein n=1 Tax=Thermofilum pendens TaxID=2269 RepID=A0A7J3X6Z7_THEPE
MLAVIRASVDRGLERRFRELAMKRFGYAKGSLQRAVEEAIMRWVAWAESELVEFEGDPVEAIDGVLAGIDLDSVELQHRARELWASKVLRDVPG